MCIFKNVAYASEVLVVEGTITFLFRVSLQNTSWEASLPFLWIYADLYLNDDWRDIDMTEEHCNITEPALQRKCAGSIE